MNQNLRKKYLIKEMKSIKEEASKGVITNFNNYVNAHPISEEIDTMQNMIRWVKSARVFKKNTNKSG